MKTGVVRMEGCRLWLTRPPSYQLAELAKKPVVRITWIWQSLGAIDQHPDEPTQRRRSPVLIQELVALITFCEHSLDYLIRGRSERAEHRLKDGARFAEQSSRERFVKRGFSGQ